jgi:deoxycytidylate deaminase
MLTPEEATQRAVDIVLNSSHPSSKIAAALYRDDTIICRTNDWPPRLRETLGTEARIGDSSGTVHAEIGCILNFPTATDGASLCVTDPFCPNCAKGAAEAGIKTIYIDHKGFTKDFAQRRGDDFESMSLRIAQRAGISVYEIRRKEKLLIPILVAPADYIPPQDNPIEIKPFAGESATLADLRNLVHSVRVKKDRWACGFAQNTAGEIITLTASLHAAIGYSEDSEKDHKTIANSEGKYSFFLEPTNRLLMGAARFGYRLMDGLVWSAQLPTSRELVNLLATPIKTLTIGDLNKGRNETCLTARDQLQSAGILTFKSL